MAFPLHLQLPETAENRRRRRRLFGAHSALLTLLKHLANVFLAVACKNAEEWRAIFLR